MRAVLFDIDDTLLATIEAKWACHKAVAKKHWNIDLTDETLTAHWGKPLSLLIEHLYESNGTPESRLEAVFEMDPEYPKSPFSNAATIIQTLVDNGVLVGLITGGPEVHALEAVELLGLTAEHFVLIQGEDSHPAHKPDPAVFEPAIERLAKYQIDRSEVAYVGDSLLDAAAAIGAGLTFVGVTTGLASADALTAAGAAAVIDDIGDLVAVDCIAR